MTVFLQTQFTPRTHQTTVSGVSSNDNYTPRSKQQADLHLNGRFTPSQYQHEYEEFNLSPDDFSRLMGRANKILAEYQHIMDQQLGKSLSKSSSIEKLEEESNESSNRKQSFWFFSALLSACIPSFGNSGGGLLDSRKKRIDNIREKCKEKLSEMIREENERCFMRREIQIVLQFGPLNEQLLKESEWNEKHSFSQTIEGTTVDDSDYGEQRDSLEEERIDEDDGGVVLKRNNKSELTKSQLKIGLGSLIGKKGFLTSAASTPRGTTVANNQTPKSDVEIFDASNVPFLVFKTMNSRKSAYLMDYIRTQRSNSTSMKNRPPMFLPKTSFDENDVEEEKQPSEVAGSFEAFPSGLNYYFDYSNYNQPSTKQYSKF